MARQSGFQQREPRKITPQRFVHAWVSCALAARFSYEAIASAVGILEGEPVSKQALAKRCDESAADFLRHALFRVLGAVARVQRSIQSGLFETFTRVLIQDSTVLALHPRLADAFPGSRNQHAKTHASAKLQVTYDLLQEQFVDFALTAFTRNDQAASSDLLTYVKAGDLILRDLGYFVLSVFKALQQRGAFFLSRLPSHVHLFTAESQRFDLLKHLQREGRLDRRLWDGQRAETARAHCGHPASPGDGRCTAAQGQSESGQTRSSHESLSGSARLGNFRNQCAAIGLVR